MTLILSISEASGKGASKDKSADNTKNVIVCIDKSVKRLDFCFSMRRFLSHRQLSHLISTHPDRQYYLIRQQSRPPNKSSLMHRVDDLVELKLDDASVKIHLHGATVTSWQKAGKELLFLSSKALLDGSKPIRGGIPLVFPQFGTGPIMAGQHGFARTRRWNCINQSGSKATFALNNSEETLQAWPHEFELNYTVELKPDSLVCEFVVKNCSNQALQFTSLLHTYFNIGDISSVRIEGLSRLTFKDKLHNYEAFKEERSVIDSINGEVDRNYINVPGPVKLQSENSNLQITSNFSDLGTP